MFDFRLTLKMSTIRSKKKKIKMTKPNSFRTVVYKTARDQSGHYPLQYLEDVRPTKGHADYLTSDFQSVLQSQHPNVNKHYKFPLDGMQIDVTNHIPYL